MRFASICTLGLALFCAPVAAQTPSVTEHYRAYTAALDRGDFAAAVTEAELALAASEAANGPRTGVLALNLAIVREQSDNAAGALAPAQRAFELAQAGAPGVDPTLATLILGRAELAVSGRPGFDRLAPLFASGNFGAASDDHIYPAASDFGRWATEAKEFDAANTAWQTAERYATGARFGEVWARANAQTWQASIIIMREAERRHGGSWNRDDMEAAYRLLGDADLLLRPAASIEAPNGELTIANMAYAGVLAWRAVLRARMQSQGMRIPALSGGAEGDLDGAAELGPIDLTAPRCLVRPRTSRLEYPRDELNDSAIGAVVLHLRISGAAEVVSSDVVTHVGSAGFAEAVERSRWRIQVSDESSPHCRMPRSMLVPIIFSTH